MERTIYHFEDLAGSAALRTVPLVQHASAPQRGAAARVGVIFNERSHRNKAVGLAVRDRPGVSIARPVRREDIAAALVQFAEDGIDLLVISGGDGTVRDVLTLGQGIFGAHWPQLAFLPKGKTNALNVDLGAPDDWTLDQAIAAYEHGRRVVRRPLTVRREGSSQPAILGFVLGAGSFTLGVEAGQDAHRIGFFNSLAVGMTGAWGVMQALFGSDSNRWRRGLQLGLSQLDSARALPHSGRGDPARRNVMLATTLRKMPFGVKIFDEKQQGIRLAILDKPLRRILLSLPAIVLGWRPKWLKDAGWHNVESKGFSMDIGESFILDGEHFGPGHYRVEQGPELTFIST